jgi:hypothetical protein
MAAIVATKVAEITGLLPNMTSGTSSTFKRYTILEVNATTTAASNTLDLATVAKVSGIFGPLIETEAGKILQGASSSTFSGTTATFVGCAVGGAYRGLWIVEQ